MRKIWQLSLGLLSCGGLLWGAHALLPSLPILPGSLGASRSEVPQSTSVAQGESSGQGKVPQYNVYKLPQSDVYTLAVAPSSDRFVVQVDLSEQTSSLAQFAERRPAILQNSAAPIAVINAGFFDPVNQKSTSYVTIKGQPVADPTQNDQLTQNPKLQPYLDKIFNRTEFRRYQCGQNVQYAIVSHQAAVPSNCQLMDAVGGGPRLLPTLTAAEEGFVDEATGRDAIGMRQPNARSAIGITHDGTVVLVMAAQKAEAPDHSGLSLVQLADFMKRLGVEQAMNLDGGTSSALFYKGRVVYGKVDEAGKAIQRPVKSVLMVREK